METTLTLYVSSYEFGYVVSGNSFTGMNIRDERNEIKVTVPVSKVRTNRYLGRGKVEFTINGDLD